jgi:hypothetical protein
MNSNSTLQQTERTINNAPAAPQRPRAASQPPSVANRVSSPAVTAVAAAGVPALTAGNGLTDQERETAQHVLNALSKHREADPFRGPVDWEALVRAAAATAAVAPFAAEQLPSDESATWTLQQSKLFHLQL